MKISPHDKKCLEKAIEVANEAYRSGNYPVGAVLAINSKIIDTAGNEITSKKSFVNHAENTLIIRNGSVLYDAYNQGLKIALYSTLEPCIQCLGASVTNHINHIYYIQKDPNGGACALKHDNIGLWYRKAWPEIHHFPFTDQPKQLMLTYFHEEIARGNSSGWPQKMISLLTKW